MAASRNDSAVLATDSTFQNRVKQSLAAQCIAISSEAVGSNPNQWLARHRQAANMLNSLSSAASTMLPAICTDASVLSDATQAGTVALTTGNVATQAQLVTDAHIDAAVSAQFNAFIAI